MAVLLEWINRVEGDGIRVYRSATPIDITALPMPIATLAADVSQYLDASGGGGEYYAVSMYKGASEKIAFVKAAGDYVPPPVDVMLPLVNPGFETGDLTGWEIIQNAWSVSSAASHSGTYSAHASGSVASTFYIRQLVDVSEYATKIDAGLLFVDGAGWLKSDGNDALKFWIGLWETELVPTAFIQSAIYSGASWFEATLSAVPVTVGTRFLEFRFRGDKVFTMNSYFDDASLRLYE